MKDFVKDLQHGIVDIVHLHFFDKKRFQKKMALKNPKTLRKCEEILQLQMLEMQFVKALISL